MPVTETHNDTVKAEVDASSPPFIDVNLYVKRTVDGERQWVHEETVLHSEGGDVPDDGTLITILRAYAYGLERGEKRGSQQVKDEITSVLEDNGVRV